MSVVHPDIHAPRLNSMPPNMRVVLTTCLSVLVCADGVLAQSGGHKNYSLITYTNKTYTSLTGSSLRAYSLQEALDMDTGYNERIELFTDGCLQPQGPPNCTATCNDNATAFGNLQDLRDCMSYPTVALAYQNQDLSDAFIDTANNLGIQPSRDNGSSSPVFKLIQTCLVDHCNMIPGCGETWAWRSQMAPFNESESDMAFIGLVYTVCEALPASLDSDIGGVGVL